MKRKLLATMLSVAVGVMTLGTTCFAAGGGELTDPTATTGMTIEGNSSVKNPVYKVVVPTDIAFGIDAFEQAGQTNSQISSADMHIYNKSNVAVRVQADIKLTPATGVTLVDTADKVTETDDSKMLFIGAEIPKTVALTLATAADATGDDATAVASYTKHSDGKLYLTAGLTADETGTGGDFNGESAAAAADIQSQTIASHSITYAAGSEADPQYIVALGTEDVSLAFALEKADYHKVYNKSSDATGEDKFYKAASAADGATAFRLTGAVNSRAAWAASDVKAEITYSFLGIRNANYATQADDKTTDNPNIAYVDDTAKLLKETTGPVFTTDDTTLGLVTYTVGEGNDALKTITGITWEYEGEQVPVLSTNVIYNADAKTLSLTEGTMSYWSPLVSTKVATVTYTTVGDATKTASVTFKLQ